MQNHAGLDETLARLTAPVGVFDGGIGSFDLVRRLRASHPRQDIIYLADRASFPYGGKDPDQLLASVLRAARGLIEMGAGSIVLASNAPSVTVLDRLRPLLSVPILGIAPPIRQALRMLPEDGVLVVAGAGVMIRDPALARLIAAEAGDAANRVVPVAAERLIALVESGAFLDRERVLPPVQEFLTGLRAEHPGLAGLSLSSTHLPWLRPAIEELAPELMLFDPAQSVVEEFAPHASQGSGRLVSVVTESAEHPVEEFEAMIAALGLDLEPFLVELSDPGPTGPVTVSG